MSVSFDIIIDKKQYIWLMRRKIKKYFGISYCRKGKGVSTLIDDGDNYIIKVLRRSIDLIVSDNTEEQTNKFIDDFIEFINLNFKNTTIGFIQHTGDKISLDKFKDMKVIDIV